MTRSDIIASFRGIRGPSAIIRDLTPTPLTASNKTGEWVACPGMLGFFEAHLSGTSDPTADIFLEGSNLQYDGGKKLIEGIAITGVSTVFSDHLYSAPAFVRLRIDNITGDDVEVTATISWS